MRSCILVSNHKVIMNCASEIQHSGPSRDKAQHTILSQLFIDIQNIHQLVSLQVYSLQVLGVGGDIYRKEYF